MIFTKTSIGYSHIKSGKPCQDFSSCYHNEERIILTCSDGHGGDLYVRSQYGSKFASDALIRTFLRVEKQMLYPSKIKNTLENVKLNILCEWNTLVEEHLRKYPIYKRDVSELKESDVLKLKKNPVKAYGTTLCGAMVFCEKLICVQIGDGGAFLLQKESAMPMFAENDEEQVGNLTYSMCEDDTFQHMQAGVFEKKSFDGVLLCTDGVVNPYQNYMNFSEYFIKKAVADLKGGNAKKLEDFIVSLGLKDGLGDDVSLVVWLKV